MDGADVEEGVAGVEEEGVSGYDCVGVVGGGGEGVRCESAMRL